MAIVENQALAREVGILFGRHEDLCGKNCPPIGPRPSYFIQIRRKFGDAFASRAL
jgi:hypothetical protein